MALSVDGVADKAVNVLSGKIVTDAATAGGAPTATGVSVLYRGEVPLQLHKVRVDWSAFTAAATTQDITLWTLPAGFVLQRIIAEVVTVFAGGAVSDADITVGSSAGGNQFLLSFDVDTAAIIAGDVVAEIGAGLVDATRADVGVTANEFAAVTLQLRMTTVGANVNALTSGTVDFYVIGHQLPIV